MTGSGSVRHAGVVAGLCLVLSLHAVSVLADMIDTSGLQPWEVCGLCHSLDGISPMSRFPKLAGQRKTYIEKQFRDFHTARRENDRGQMQAITTEVDLKDLPAIADYFSSLPPPPAAAVEDAANIGDAEAIFRDGRGGIPACLSCHGTTDPAMLLAPWLEAQHEDYLVKQLMDFRAGNRTNDPEGVMRTIAAQLSDKDVSDLAAYIAAQDRPERTP
jgi:cytochrome c553